MKLCKLHIIICVSIFCFTNICWVWLWVVLIQHQLQLGPHPFQRIALSTSKCMTVNNTIKRTIFEQAALQLHTSSWNFPSESLIGSFGKSAEQSGHAVEKCRGKSLIWETVTSDGKLSFTDSYIYNHTIGLPISLKIYWIACTVVYTSV